MIVGLITYIFGDITFYLTYNHKNKEHFNKPKGLSYGFFLTGFIIHLLFEFTGFNKPYCNRYCRKFLLSIDE